MITNAAQLNAAKHDLAFQFFLARSFGERFLAREGTIAIVCRHWRGVIYVIEQISGLDPVPFSGRIERI